MIFNRIHKTADDRGMTLVEVLVAVAIFGIIVGPICFSFITTVHVNNVSRQIEEATTAGSNVMEELKELDMNQLLQTLAKEDVPEGDADVADTATILGRQYDMIVDTDGVYVLTTKETVNKRDYVVRMKLSPVVDNSEPVTSYTDYNDKDLVNLYSMSQGQDGIFSVGSSMDDDTAALFLDNISEVTAQMRREITLDVASDTVLATAKYTYKGNTEVAVNNQPIYSSDDSSVNLRNIYLFFNPLYSGNNKESVIVNNPDSVPFNLYLIKLGEDSPTKNIGYGVKVVVNEPGTKYNTVIRTNLSEAVLMMDSVTQGKMDVTEVSYKTKSTLAYDVLTHVYLYDDVSDDSGLIDESKMVENNRQATIEGYKEKN